jgi:hypothetical protein
MMLCASTALAQNATQRCRPARVILVIGIEPAADARLTIAPAADHSLPQRLERRAQL